MIPAAFDYSSPKTLSEAIALLEQHGADAKILAGGMSLIPLMKLRMAAPKHLIDLNGIAELAYIRESDGHLTIGALTRESDLDESALIRTKYPIIADTAAVIGDPLVRNMATVGGNLAHADPANDHPATMLALSAEVVATGPKGKRTIPLSQFFTGLFTTALEPDEILTEIRIPLPPPRSGGAYLKVERKVGDFATAAVAAQITLDGNTCKLVGIGLTNVGSTPIRATRAETALLGKPADEKNIDEAARIAAEEAEPEADLRGPADYKRLPHDTSFRRMRRPRLAHLRRSPMPSSMRSGTSACGTSTFRSRRRKYGRSFRRRVWRSNTMFSRAFSQRGR